MSTQNFLRRDLPIVLIIVAAIPMILSRFITHPALTALNAELGWWSSLINMTAWGMGVIYLFQGEYHNTKLNPTITQYLQFGTLCVYSLILLILNIMEGQQGDTYSWFYMGTYRPQSQAFYGLMFLYLCSAGYRMLRLRSAESAVLALSGLIYICRSGSLFALYTPWIIPLGEWLMNYPGKAASTAAVMTMAMGAVLIAVRQTLGRERTAVDVM